jgi:hypothetical protein
MTSVQAFQVAHRGELLAELFLQELNPVFVAKSTQDVGYDFVAGFTNRQKGINTFAIEVKSTAQPIKGKFPLSTVKIPRFGETNVPVMLLVVDVKHNEFWYAWVQAALLEATGSAMKRVPLTKLDDAGRSKLINELTSPVPPATGS